MQPDQSLTGWYYKRDGQRIGPISLDQVGYLLATGQLEPSEMLIEIAEARCAAGPTTKYSYVDAASAATRRDAVNGETVRRGVGAP